MILRAKDIMQREVVTAGPSMKVREVSVLLVDNEISGVPVVDAKGDLVGVISQTDLVRREREDASSLEIPEYYRDEETAVFVHGWHVQNPDKTSVSDVMTPVVISADEDTPIKELAKSMVQKRIHRLVITKNGRLSGIVTSTDLVRAFYARR